MLKVIDFVRRVHLHTAATMVSTEPARKVRKISSSANFSTTPDGTTTKTLEQLKLEASGPVNFNDISDDNTVLKFKKLTPNATTPLRGSRNAAGFDLFSAETKEIDAQSHSVVKTDIAVMLPPGTYGRVAPRSGLAVKHFIQVGAGVVDFDYRGNVGVVLFNHKKDSFQVSKGDRIAQFIVEKICMPTLVEVKVLEETERGAGGYGSTGK